LTYKDSGVDVNRGYEAVKRIRPLAKSTFRPEVLGDLGGFGGFFALPRGLAEPVLVSGADGVGTKLRIAFASGRHDTVGIDCVAMCVNDIAAQGAEPLFFLDYLALGRLEPALVEEVVRGVAEGCRMAGCALIGGETAEMPGFYPPGEYDLAGFAVGVVERQRIIDGREIREGDALIGLASTGVHSNGFSLVRRVIEEKGLELSAKLPGLVGTLGEELLKPTRIYVPALKALREAVTVRGVAHITGGGFVENIPRAIPAGLAVEIHSGAWSVPAIFHLIMQAGDVPESEMFQTFNMGIGLVVVVPRSDAAAAMEAARTTGCEAWEIGLVRAGEGVHFR
jgi:phosphoribosylformylglycinamidine cyclo-ligase